jgi:hypothetical protein
MPARLKMKEAFPALIGAKAALDESPDSTPPAVDRKLERGYLRAYGNAIRARILDDADASAAVAFCLMHPQDNSTPDVLQRVAEFRGVACSV